MPKAPKSSKPGRSALADVVAREYTIHLHKRVRFRLYITHCRLNGEEKRRGEGRERGREKRS